MRGNKAGGGEERPTKLFAGRWGRHSLLRQAAGWAGNSRVLCWEPRSHEVLGRSCCCGGHAPPFVHMSFKSQRRQFGSVSGPPCAAEGLEGWTGLGWRSLTSSAAKQQLLPDTNLLLGPCSLSWRSWVPGSRNPAVLGKPHILALNFFSPFEMMQSHQFPKNVLC